MYYVVVDENQDQKMVGIFTDYDHLMRAIKQTPEDFAPDPNDDNSDVDLSLYQVFGGELRYTEWKYLDTFGFYWEQRGGHDSFPEWKLEVK